MSSKVTKLVVGKGKTTGNEKQSEWIKRYFELGIELGDPSEVEVAKANALGLIDGWLNTSAAPPMTAPATQSTTPTKPLEIFPKNLADLLVVTEKGAFIVFKPRAYLRSDDFAKIAAIVRDKGGEYVSAGKESHFRISKAKTTKQ